MTAPHRVGKEEEEPPEAEAPAEEAKEEGEEEEKKEGSEAEGEEEEEEEEDDEEAEEAENEADYSKYMNLRDASEMQLVSGGSMLIARSYGNVNVYGLDGEKATCLKIITMKGEATSAG